MATTCVIVCLRTILGPEMFLEYVVGPCKYTSERMDGDHIWAEIIGDTVVN